MHMVKQSITDNPNVELRKIDHILDPRDINIALVSSTFKTHVKEVEIDNSGLDSYPHIFDVVNSRFTRLLFVNNIYVGLVYLDSFKEGLHASIHGFIRKYEDLNNPTKPTSKYFKLFKSVSMFDIILDSYFKEYNIETIEGHVPEFLEDKKVTDKVTKDTHRVKLPLAKLLYEAGFRRMKEPRRNACFKDGRRCASFLYQIHRYNFNKWLAIKNDYIFSDKSIDELAIKHNVSAEILACKSSKWKKRS